MEVYANIERCLRNDRVRDQLRKPSAKMRRFKNVLEDPAKIDPRNIVSEYRHRTVSKIQRANVVKPEDVVNVAVSYQDGVEIIHPGAQGLRPKGRRGIDQNSTSRVFDQHRSAKPFVPRILGAARLTVAPDRRY